MKKTDQTKLQYLTDEELLRLIESAEADRLHAAPDYLKNNILKKAVPPKRSGRHELFFFGAKILAAGAASIALLFTAPDFGRMGYPTPQSPPVRKERFDVVREDSFFRQFNQKADRFCGLIAKGTNFMFEKEDNSNDQ